MGSKVEIIHRDELGDILVIDDTYYHDCRWSPRREYIVGARQREGRLGYQGYRPGGIALVNVKQKTIEYTKELDRPASPYVVDDGTVFFEEHSWGINGVFGALGDYGTWRWCTFLETKIGHSGLSGDGAYAFVLGSPLQGPWNARETILLNTYDGSVVWRVPGEHRVSFVGQALHAHLAHDGQRDRAFEFDEEGQLPNEYHRLAQAIREADPQYATSAAQEAVRNGDFEEAARLLLPFSAEDIEDEFCRARFLRYAGEVAESRGRRHDALDLWRRSLELNPQVGIKRRYDQLRKRLAR